MINWDEAREPQEGENTGPITAGVYPTEVRHITETYTANGDEMWRVQLRIKDGEFAGRNIFDNWVFSQKAAPRFLAIADAFGYELHGEDKPRPDMFLNRDVWTKVVEDTYQDRPQAKVDFWGYRKMEPQGKVATRVRPPATVQPNRKPPPSAMDDDVPF